MKVNDMKKEYVRLDSITQHENKGDKCYRWKFINGNGLWMSFVVGDVLQQRLLQSGFRIGEIVLASFYVNNKGFLQVCEVEHVGQEGLTPTPTI